MLKNLGANPDPSQDADEDTMAPRSNKPRTRDARTQAASRVSVPSSQKSGDLFENELDAELEIPAFLRKKKTG